MSAILVFGGTTSNQITKAPPLPTVIPGLRSQESVLGIRRRSQSERRSCVRGTVARGAVNVGDD